MPKQHENDPRMTNGDLHQISAEIGGIKKAVEMMTDLWRRQEETATAGRRALHDKFENFKDDVSLQIAGLSLRVDRLTDKVSMIEPSVTAFKDKIQDDKDDALIAEGAKKFGLKIWAGLMGGATVVGYVIHEIVTYYKHG